MANSERYFFKYTTTTFDKRYLKNEMVNYDYMEVMKKN